MDNIPPLVLFAGAVVIILMVVKAEQFIEWLKRLETENKQLRLKNEELKKKEGLPFLLRNAPLKTGVTYEIRLVTYTATKDFCYIFIELEPQTSWVVIQIDPLSEIISTDICGIQSGNYFVLWIGDGGPFAKGTLKDFKKIEIVPNPNMKDMLT
ncbi:MAG: hypothetical protein K9M11_00855 [Candidatus Pacebacteria bacterium]|nr:hypothetical protein [Candidatus Paceibacterota bacterium]